MDTENHKIRFKRKCQSDDFKVGDQDKDEKESIDNDYVNGTISFDSRNDCTEHTEHSVETDEVQELIGIIPEVLKILEQSGQKSHFIDTLKSIHSGKMKVTNIAFQLLLDVGHYLSLECSSQMRYSKTSLDFWCIVQKLFKGKALRFFSGSKAVTGKFSIFQF